MINRGLKSAAMIFRPFGTTWEWLRLLINSNGGMDGKMRVQIRGLPFILLVG